MARNYACPPIVLKVMLMKLFLQVTLNLFLAAVPVVLAQVICRSEPRWRGRTGASIGIAALLLLWLVFLPNTCYLLTEWRHFLVTLDASNLYLRSQVDHRITLLLMLYTAFFFCYSAVGMLAFALAIRPVDRLVRKDGNVPWVWGTLLFLLVSLGVFLGLVPRFNSWNLATHPARIFTTIGVVFHHPVLSAFLVVFAGMLWLMYVAIDIWIDGFLLRWPNTSDSRVHPD
jgi:uncharacterized membrane protein